MRRAYSNGSGAFPRARSCPNGWVGTARVVRVLRAALALLLLASSSWCAPAARLRASGWPLPSREADALFAASLRAPADSTALAQALDRAGSRLQSAGWLDGRVAAEWNREANVLTLLVEAGTRYRWGRSSFDVPRADSSLLATLLVWPQGAPVDPGQWAARVADALRAAEERGHAWAQLSLSDWDVDSGRVNVRMAGTLGPRVLADSVSAAFGSGAISVNQVLDASPGFAKATQGDVVTAPFGNLEWIKERVANEAQIKRIDDSLRDVWGAKLKTLGIDHAANDFVNSSSAALILSSMPSALMSFLSRIEVNSAACLARSHATNSLS